MKDLKPKFKWTRVRDGSNIKYVRTRTDNDRIIDEDFDFNTGKFKMYLNQDINSGFSYGTLTENKPKKENNEVAVVGSKKPKSYAWTRNSAYHPEDAEEFFNLTGLGLIINPYRLTRKALNLLDKPSLSTTTDLAPEVLPYSKAGRFALGTYNLFNKEGLPKTYNYVRQGEYGRAGLSALGDVLNAGMAIEGGTTVVPKIVKGVNTGMRILNSPITGEWTTIGRNLYRLNPNMLGMNTIIGGIEKLSPTLKAKGWTLTEDGVFINPQGLRFIRNAEGKLLSENSLKETIKTEIMQKKMNELLLSQNKQSKDLQKIILNFENAGIFGFRTKEWKAMRKGFRTTNADIAEYESHVPEYYEIFKDLKERGLLKETKEGWKGDVEKVMVKVNPRQYIIANHPNFIDNGWKFDPVNRGTAMFPETGIKIQGNGGLDAANWGTNSNEQLGVFSQLRDNGPILRGIVSTRNKPDRIVPVRHAHEARMEKYNGITEFDKPVGLRENNNIKGSWRIYGPDMQIKAIDGNNGLFSKAIKNPLSGIIPPALLINYYSNEK